MKKIFNFLVIFVLILSSCTISVPALFGVRIVNAEYQDLGRLAVYLSNADEGIFAKVGDYTFDCEVDEFDPELLVCVGPGFEPGEELVIQFFEKGGDGKPIAELTFVAPDIPEEMQDDDHDGVANAEDKCPEDPLKSKPGECGCGKPDLDSDEDGTPDCKDEYPEDPTRSKPGEGHDTDLDGVPDSEDKCPEDPDKTKPGECGCGTPDVDEDEDGIIDCKDECPESAYQDNIGDPCDDDQDNDGVVDGVDQCPWDPFKTRPGYCGCGEKEKDTDKDGYPDCVDKCPYNPELIKPGEYGCEDACEVDTDEDGTPDCEDGCPEDRRKTEPGDCGCGCQECIDCIDLCPEDPEKCEPGICGCGDWDDEVGNPCDHDEDDDGWGDWIDQCPYDPFKKYPGDCGCGCQDCPDCIDLCPEDPEKCDPGICGCGDWEDEWGEPCIHNEDGDLLLDWEDDCPFDEGYLPNGCPAD